MSRNPLLMIFRPLIKGAAIISITLGFTFCDQSGKISQEDYNRLQDGFVNLQDTNKLWCYYYWIGDDISKEGVTKDLEAMKEFGLNTVLIGNINPDQVDGRVPLFSDEWWEVTTHVVEEGKRLGIDIGMFNCPGWSQSGGPWITYDKAMRHVVYSETHVTGGGPLKVKLPKPAEEFQDIYVLGFRSLPESVKTLGTTNARISSTPAISGINRLIDGNPATAAPFKLERGAEYSIDIMSKDAIDARSIKIHPGEARFACDVDFQAKIDGEFQSVKSFRFDRSNTSESVGPVTHGPVAMAFPVVNSDAFRLVCTNMSSASYLDPAMLSSTGFAEITISEDAVLEKYVEKSLGKMHPTPFPDFKSYLWDTQDEVEDGSLVLAEVHDISEWMNEDGVIEADETPAGEWTILRFGMTPTGTMNSPAAPQGKGYEVDKASRELARFHFNSYMKEIQERIPEESRDAFKYVIADSYEQGSQNWTDGFTGKFTKKYGYSPVDYLPVFSGRIVNSVEKSERFLWDLRRMVADDVAYGYVGGLRDVSNEHNLTLWLENYGHWGYPGEFLMYGGQSNLVAGEFWNEGELGNIECKSASSAAHIYGKPITSAEAFTAARMSYMRHPSSLKKRGDWCLTEGINHFVLHLYIHQPDERVPGVNAWFSTEFNRHNTWFDQGKNWTDYIRRCQHMQQQGKYAAEVCYFIGEDAPKMTGNRDPELPIGYSYDYINAEVILERLTVENGKFVLPDGMYYNLMVLPNVNTMRPEVLAKIDELVRMGGTVLGPKPEKSPSLQGYPGSDRKVSELADEMWKGEYSDDALIQPHGEGHILDGMGIQEALDFLGISRDVDFEEGIPILWTHRTMPGMEIYFITNQSDDELDFSPSFRVKGMKPQLWNAMTGEIRMLGEYLVEDGRTSVPLKMKAQESCYVIFSNRANDNVAAAYLENFPEAETVKAIDGEWELEFMNKDIGPKETMPIAELNDWTKSDDASVKYYSGTAVYRTTFSLDEVPAGKDFFIDLGEVNQMAEVTLNGNHLGGVWMAPFMLNAGDGLKQGENTLEVEVVNVWRNRLIRDKQLPEGERYTSVTVGDETANSPLMPAGLTGPVTLKRIAE